ncbi:Long-chain-fatty-acid--CoA ligase [Caenispirillum salinarum AK4]|uniref:Long-chain-fatty-acid--CoA ligase n=1 Tax=Caenispirillum salinarum AK4 TaxID=1238182 RepID=K9GNZ3_9PROT|nr:class I adenylate-forming enzyme family protein [Caenispirillum salinarum]EKV27635.1 Long-chain-fatty-acid--CoA ligase [Caenispirillum salinarum AK4]
MSATFPPMPPMRAEAHFGDRVVACFTDRPPHTDAMIRAAVAANTHGDAVVDGDVRLSYRDLDSHVSAVARALLARGLEAGARVGLLIGNRWEWVVAVLGTLRAGLVAVPLSTRAQGAELAYILEDCGAALVVAEPSLADRLPEGLDLIALDSPFESLLADYADGLVPDPAPAEEDLAVILYTSGTTGHPKGAMLTHLNIVHSCLHFSLCFSMTAADRSVVAVPVSHVTGLIACVLAPMSVGGAVLMLKAFKADAFLALAEGERMTYTVMVPAMYNLCLLRSDFARHDLSAWRIGAYGGAPMPEATIRKLADALPNLELANAYGATETTSPTTLMPPGGTATHSSSVGRVVPCGEVRVMDDAGREVPPGEPGEVWIAGPMVMPGYWNKPDATAENFQAGFWKSGDIGSLDADGFLRVFDRKKDMINRGGYKVFSAEVENVLAHHPAVAEVAVVPHPDPVLGEKVHAFVHAKDDISEDAIRTFCAERLSDYKVPDFVTFSREPLPRNSNGKLIKRQLRDGIEAGS